MKILVINCGSSSLKYQLIDMENEDVLTAVIFSCKRFITNWAWTVSAERFATGIITNTI